jgi:hypothetical protein
MATERETAIVKRVQELIAKLTRELPALMRSGDSWTITINGKGLDIDIDSRRKEKLGKER